MGCLCSKGTPANDYVAENEREKQEKEQLNKSSVLVVAPSIREEVMVDVSKGKTDGSGHSIPKPAAQATVPAPKDEEEKNTRIVERPKNGHQRRATIDMGVNGVDRIISMPNGAEGEQIVAGWPSWLTSVAGEAIQGWVPRSAESFEKLSKIGQGTYSSVYKARDLKTDKIVAMKKVRFVNMDPESVRFMAREICILRRLDHPNVMKLEALVTSRISGSLYLVFEYMEHDLAGLAASPKIKFTEPQIKCYMQQLLRGLEHCHSRGILHRDIKGSNLLIDNNGVLKVGDFGLANFFQPDQKQPLTSRVVTLWYRAPELLLGATEYGVAIDMWSAGCILAELFFGKPIMPGRTEVEQMHKIFKLCGSPSEEYWRKSKLPHATSFKPHHPYRRHVAETFKEFPSSALALVDVLLAIEPEERGTAAFALSSEFFTTNPPPCDPSSLPKYPPSKEFDAKIRDEEARRQKAEAVNGRPRESKGGPTPEFDTQHGQSNKSISVKYMPQEDSGTGFPIEPPRGIEKNGYSHSNSMIHPSAVGYVRTRKVQADAGQMSMGRTCGSSHATDLTSKRSHMRQVAVDPSSKVHHKRDERVSSKEPMDPSTKMIFGKGYEVYTFHRPHTLCQKSCWYSGPARSNNQGYVPKRNRILCSGPLMPPGGNMDDMLKEHERQIQEAVRKARGDKARTKNNCFA